MRYHPQMGSLLLYNYSEKDAVVVFDEGGAVPRALAKLAQLSQNFPSFVTMKTRTVWSRQLRQHRPSRSGLQSKLTIGCEEITLELRSSTFPTTPIGTLSCKIIPTKTIRRKPANRCRRQE